jgi:hypothetical protein
MKKVYKIDPVYILTKHYVGNCHIMLARVFENERHLQSSLIFSSNEPTIKL